MNYLQVEPRRPAQVPDHPRLRALGRLPALPAAQPTELASDALKALMEQKDLARAV